MNTEQIWQDTLTALQLTVSPAYFKTWFAGTKLNKIDQGLAEVGCPSSYVRSWLEERHAKQIANALSDSSGEKVEVSFVVAAGVKKKSRKEDGAPLFANVELDKERVSKKIAEAKLNPRYTLDNFVVGNNNQLAHAVAQAIIASPGKVYNPFFLYGGVGGGENHLMQSIGDAVVGKDSSWTGGDCTGEGFCKEMIGGI